MHNFNACMDCAFHRRRIDWFLEHGAFKAAEIQWQGWRDHIKDHVKPRPEVGVR